MSNKLPQFEYEKAADFIPALSERLRESEAAMASIGNMISQNNSQRLANAEQFDKTINGVAKFSKSWGTILEKRRDKRDKIYANRATLYAHQAGANQRDLAEYNDNKDKFEKDVGYINALASQADANGQHEQANYFRNLHGHELLIFKETLAKNAANNFERNFYNNIEGISIKDENGNKITWSMADGNQKIQLIDQYLVESGLDEVNGLRDDFLNDKFWPIVNRQKESILTTASKQDYNRRKAERAASIDDQLILAAETNTLGEKMLEIINTNYGDYKEGRAGARAAVIQNLDALLASGKISEEGYRQALDYSFTPDGWPENKTTTIGEHWSNDFGNIEDRIDQAKLKKYEARQNREKLDRLEFTFRIKQNLDGKPPTEQDVRDLEALWEEQHPGVEPPQYLKKLASMTVEDRIDDDIIKNLEYQFREGLPLTGIDGIYDAEKREAWQKRAASDGGQGLSKTHRQNRDATYKQSNVFSIF